MAAQRAIYRNVEGRMGFGNDSRNSFRAPVVDLREGTLRIGEVVIPVRLLDQSATGFKLATEDQRLIPEMVTAVLDFDDGVWHDVEIRRVGPSGEERTIGVKLLQTRAGRSDDSSDGAPPRRTSLAKIAAILLFIVVTGLALQAAPVQRRLAEMSPFGAPKRQQNATASGAAADKTPSPPVLDRKQPFRFQRYLEDDAADWLQLSTQQRSVMRGLMNYCGGVGENRLAPSQHALLEFAAKASMLDMLGSEQRSRLEKELDRPLSGSDLLADVVGRYSERAGREELLKVFGSLLVVVPEIATEFKVSDETAAAVRRKIDETFGAPLDEAVGERLDADADQSIIQVTLRLQQLEENCRKLLEPAAKASR